MYLLHLGPRLFVFDKHKITDISDAKTTCMGSIVTPVNIKHMNLLLGAMKLAGVSKVFVGIKDKENNKNKLTYLDGKLKHISLSSPSEEKY